MPSDVSPGEQQIIDSIPLDFEQNLSELEEFFSRFLATLRTTTMETLQEKTRLAYPDYPPEAIPTHLLGFHQAFHLTAHDGQIRTIRNLFRKTRGEPARFFPENPSYPR